MYVLSKKILSWGNHLFQYAIVETLHGLGKVLYYGKSHDCRIQESHHIVVIRLDEIGDMVMMSPFLRELRRNYPTAQITLVVKSEVYNLVERCPYVNKVLSFSRKGGRCSFYRNLLHSLVFSYHYLKNRHYDLALVPRFDADAGYGGGMLAFLSGAKRRVGYSERVLPHKMISDKGYDGFYTDVLLPEGAVVSHEVERNFDILRFIGGIISDEELEVWTAEEDVAQIEEMLCNIALKHTKLVAVVLSAGRKNKEWDVQCYVKVIQKVASEIPLQVLLLGAGLSAEKKGKLFCSHVPNTINLINKTTLRESTEALRKCDCYLGGDTGLLHIAASLKMKGVALFVNRIEWRKDGLDTPDRFGPWKSEISVLQPAAPLSGCENGCNHKEAHCIFEIRVEDVIERLLEALKSSGRGGD